MKRKIPTSCCRILFLATTPPTERPDGSNPTTRMLIENLAIDIRHGLRLILRAPGFAFAAILSLALGIGANTAMFSVVHGVLLRPLPFPEADELVGVWSENRRLGIARQPSGYANIADWRESVRTIETLAVYDPVSVTIAAGEARRTSAALVSPNLSRVLRIKPLAGRMFTDDEANRRVPVAVISHAEWQRHYGGADNVLGRRIEIDGQPVEIIGILPPGIRFPDKQTELWLPHTLARDWNTAQFTRGVSSWRAIGRLAPGASLALARAEFSAIAGALENAFPTANADLGIRVERFADQVIGSQLRVALLVLLGAVAAVLLIACSNVGNLLLARGLARQREFAIRLSLGATRRRLIGQLLVENIVLSTLAAAAGAILAWHAIDAIRVFGPQYISRLDEVRLDATALAFAILLGVGSACLFGLLPALKTTRGDTHEMLRDGTRGSSEGRPGRRLRGLLVVVEFALAVVLLAGAGMLVRSFEHLLSVDPGFEAEGVLLVPIRFPGHRSEVEAAPYARQVVERVVALPGVVSAAISEEVLLSERGEQTVSIEGATPGQLAAARMPLSFDAVTPDYFRAMGVGLRQGRIFAARDDSQVPAVAIVNETLAQRLWPGESPIGRRLRRGGADSRSPWATVVGVVADQRRQGLERSPIPEMFVPFEQQPSGAMNLIVRTTMDPAALARDARRTAQAVDPTVPVQSATTLRDEMDRTLAPRRFQTGLLSAFGVMALVLAGAGIFGLMHYSVVRRTHEIGIRAALGATPRQVLRLILTEGLGLAVAGVALGIGLAFAVLRTLSALLYEVAPTDPISLAASAGALLIVATLACLLPGFRASRIDPMAALRVE